MILTKWERDQYYPLHKKLQGRDAEELRALLKASEEMDVEMEEGDEIEIPNARMEICYRIAKRSGIQFPQDERALEFAEKLESL